MPLTVQEIKSSFKWLLGRGPENDAIDWHKINLPDINSLRRHLMNTSEFKDYLHFNLTASRDPTLDLVTPKLVFLHLPKTGGTSLTRLLANGFAEEEIFADSYSIGRYEAAYLAQFKFFRGHFTMHEISLIPGKVRTLTVLREPLARIISQYRFHRAHLAQHVVISDDLLIKKAMLPFKDYLRDPEIRAHAGVNNSAARALFSINASTPAPLREQAIAQYQQQGVVSADIMIALALTNLKSMYWVCTTEKLSASVNYLLSSLGFEYLSPSTEWRHMVTDKLSTEEPDRYAPSNSIEIDEEILMLAEELIYMDRALHNYVDAQQP